MLVAQEPTHKLAPGLICDSLSILKICIGKRPQNGCPLLEQGRRTTMQPSDGQLDRLRNRQREKKASCSRANSRASGLLAIDLTRS
jgi:hypothetical protein